MRRLYPEIEPFEHGWLEVDAGHAIYWECSGDPEAPPAVVLHGGPGAASGARYRRLFDPTKYRIVLVDQRNCGRSTPHASAPGVDLSGNTTQSLVGDLERLRVHLEIDSWLVLGGSWGSTLGLIYAEAYPRRVSALVLFGLFLGTRAEIDWVFRGGLGARFPMQWHRLRTAVRASDDAAVVAAAHELLFDVDADTRRRIAHEWCVWESSILQDPPGDELLPLCGDERAALAFARIVTHYVLNDCWLEDGALLEAASAIADIPTVLINGSDDPQAGRLTAELARRLDSVEVIRVEGAGHSAKEDSFVATIVSATDRLAAPKS